jgi:7,8-dihydro-6-hydroxymethylpterin-pyrophosphokinase
LIESKLGRIKKNTDRYEDRIIDLDILFYGEEIIENEIITIPHKEIPNRRFVLDPLNELTPDFIHPVLKKSIHVLLENCQDTSILEQITNN